jgi:type I restriction enzyme R subunit
LKESKDSTDAEIEARLAEEQAIADELAEAQTEPERLNLIRPGEYGLFTVLRANHAEATEAHLAECAGKVIEHLNAHQVLSPGWSTSKGGRMRVEQALIPELWNHPVLGLEDSVPPYLADLIDELAGSDR